MNPRPLSYEPYDVCLCRLGPSPAIALTSPNDQRAVVSSLRVSPVSERSVMSRAQIRAQNLVIDLWVLPVVENAWPVGLPWVRARSFPGWTLRLPKTSSASECRFSGSGSGFAAVTWVYASCACVGLPCMSRVYPRGSWRSRAVVGPSLGSWTLPRLRELLRSVPAPFLLVRRLQF